MKSYLVAGDPVSATERQADSEFVVARFAENGKTTIGLLKSSGLRCFANSPPDDRFEKMTDARSAAIRSCRPLLDRALPVIARWCPHARVADPDVDTSSGHYAVGDDEKTCGFKAYLSSSTVAQAGWHRPSGGHSGFFPGWDQVLRSAFGVEAGVGARAQNEKQRSAILDVAEHFVDACLSRAADDYRELRLVFRSDRPSTERCLPQADPIPSTIGVHERWHVLEYHGGRQKAALDFDGDDWVAKDTYVVSGPLADCPGNPMATCGTNYGYREISWRLKSISTNGDGELTILDHTANGKTCRRVEPLRAVLMNSREPARAVRDRDAQ